MPLWGRTDNYQDKPKFPVERFEEGAVWLTANASPQGNTIYFAPQGPYGSTTANVGIGYMANGVNLPATIGFVGFNLANGLTVKSITANSVTLSGNTEYSIPANAVISFSKPMLNLENGRSANSVNANTIFVTASRINNNAHWSNVSVTCPGHIQVRVGSGMRAGRIQMETLVALSNGVAYNINSGGPYFPGY